MDKENKKTDPFTEETEKLSGIIRKVIKSWNESLEAFEESREDDDA